VPKTKKVKDDKTAESIPDAASVPGVFAQPRGRSFLVLRSRSGIVFGGEIQQALAGHGIALVRGYARLPAPFDAPIDDTRTPFGHDVQSQQALVERSPDGQTTWVAWALIARLLAGDGFYGPEQGAGVIADCVVALFYNDHEINRTDVRREALTVDGHEAYLIESHLTFDIPGIKAKGETMIVVVVDVGTNGEAGLFYGTIPDNAPQFLPPIRAALADLQVG